MSKQYNKEELKINIVSAALSYRKNTKWKQTWQNSCPENYITGELYPGFTCLGGSRYWITEDQLKELGTKAINTFGVPESWLGIYQHGIKFYNIENCTGIKIPKVKLDKKYSKCEKIVKKYLNYSNVKIELDFTSPFYNRVFDIIRIPDLNYFINPESYYASLYHELVHSTAHKKRLGRFRTKLPKRESKNYKEEELVAELGSCILSVRSDISSQTFYNSLAYINNVLKDILSDSRIINKENHKKKIVEKCYKKAEAAVEYILGM